MLSEVTDSKDPSSTRHIMSRESHILTDEQAEKWHKARRRIGGPSDFGCLLCGCMFKGGDTIRWIYANGGGHRCRLGNFFVCNTCDCKHMKIDDVILETAQSLYESINPILRRVLRQRRSCRGE